MDIIKLIKDWTLPVSMCTGTLLYLLFAFVPVLDGAATFFAPVFDAILPLFMFLILFVTFCKVDFRKLRPVGWHLWVKLNYSHFQQLCKFLLHLEFPLV